GHVGAVEQGRLAAAHLPVARRAHRHDDEEGDGRIAERPVGPADQERQLSVHQGWLDLFFFRLRQASTTCARQAIATAKYPATASVSARATRPMASGLPSATVQSKSVHIDPAQSLQSIS